ncbi:MAG: hypothetical protein HOQ16_02690, partial [Gemmatimonadaceae bacterium]|nr:hypothetical protein [Gemmatimonadaceae bacterium]
MLPGAARGGVPCADALRVVLAAARTGSRLGAGFVGSEGRGFGVTGAGIVETGARVLVVGVAVRGGATAGVVARDV